MRESLILALATLVILTGCNVQRANDTFRTGYRRSFLQQCTESLSGSPAERVSGSYCTCVADELLKRFSSADLARCPLHIASKKVTDEVTVVTRRCAKVASELPSLTAALTLATLRRS